MKMFKNKKSLVILSLIMISLVSLLLFSFTKSVELENNVQVEQDSELIYYLNVNYDGVDKTGLESSDTVIADIRSGYIEVTDILPAGLTFTGFVESPNTDGSIGAASRGNESKSCLGKVVDDDGVVDENNYHGLHYDETNRKVTFKVKNLQAGCVLTVGIKTRTPSSLGGNAKLDFYNFATAKEDTQTVNSNTVHVWMGSDKETQYNVTYQYSGTVPEGAPILPDSMSYAAGADVGVASDVNLAGYKFSGWTAVGITITNGSFTMPSSNVTFIGSFTEMPKHLVTYTIKEGTSIPESYELPSVKEYSPDVTVKLDALKVGDIINGYRFKGWTTSDVTVSSDNDFLMPEKNVTFIGEFEPVKYKVKYEFNNTVTFDNMNNYLPPEQEFAPGDEVTLATIDDSMVSGYKFLGWYSDNTFTMPEHDVTIEGEWKVQAGTFSPTITKEIVNEKEYYKPGDIINFNVTITNPESFALNTISVKEFNDKVTIKEGTGYTIPIKKMAQITTLAAGASITIPVEYKVTDSDIGTLTFKTEIIGASSDQANYEMDTSKDYTQTKQIKVKSPLKICQTLDKNINQVSQYHITSTDGYDSWINLSEIDECTTIYVKPGNYKVQDITSQDYTVTSVTGAISANNESFDLGEEKYEITFNKKQKRQTLLHSFGRIINKITGGEGS